MNYVIAFAIGIATAIPSLLAAQGGVPLIAAHRAVVIDGTANHLSRTNWIGVTSDGSIAVLQPTLVIVRFFDANGRALGRVGKRGSGTGGFAVMGRAGWVGDTLWVADVTQQRITYISPSRKVLRTAPMASDVTLSSGESLPFLEGAAGAGPSPVASYRDRTSLNFGVTGSGAVPASLHELSRSGAALLHLSSDGTLLNVAAWIPSSDACQIRAGRGGAGLPYCTAPLYAVAPDGRSIAIVDMDRASAPQTTFSVVLLSPRGDTLFAHRFPFVGVPIPAHDVDSAIAVRIASTQVLLPEATPGLRAYHPAFYPAVQAALIGRDGRVWVQLHGGATDQQWLVLGVDGNAEAKVTLPASVTVRAATATALWVTEPGTDGSISVVRYDVPLAGSPANPKT
ncbi:MAG TPA: hypothetical protein VHW65_05905 [Gemmatimonadales bacterium]|nr:hypothetical protein [Gemmatimonadales bacterium]